MPKTPQRRPALLIASVLALLSVSGILIAQPRAAERKYAFRTLAGYYLTAENGGGTVVNTDRKELGPWEEFTLVQTAPGVFALRTETGHYLSDSVLRRGGGGGGGYRRQSQQQQQQQTARGGLVATARDQDTTTQFKIMVLNPEGPLVALVTSDGKFVTAENGGGMKARNARAMASDRSEIGEWETFTLVDVEKFRAAGGR